MDPGKLDAPTHFHFNRFRRLQVKVIHTILHLTMLREYLIRGDTPKGLKVSTPLQAVAPSESLRTSWSQVLKASSTHLLQLLIYHYNDLLSSLQKDTTAAFWNLADCAQFSNSILDRLRSYAFKTWTVTKPIKLRKLTRDFGTSEIFVLHNSNIRNTFIWTFYSATCSDHFQARVKPSLPLDSHTTMYNVVHASVSHSSMFNPPILPTYSLSTSIATTHTVPTHTAPLQHAVPRHPAPIDTASTPPLPSTPIPTHTVATLTNPTTIDPTRAHRNRRFTNYKKNKQQKRKEKRLAIKAHNSSILNNTIVNLSEYTLSNVECDVLTKNLQFCPTPQKLDHIQLSLDLFQFSRRLRLAEFFCNNDTDNINSQDTPIVINPKLKKKSTFTPPSGRDVALDAYIEAVESDIMNTATNPKFSNISNLERTALRNLKDNPNIVIKPADKGGSVVVLNRTDYIEEGNRQLSDVRFYQKLTADPTIKHNSIVTKAILEGVSEGHINTHTSEVLINKSPIAGRFYMLPKIHKANNPGRPIVSGNNTPTENISAYIDTHLKPLVYNLDSYVHDDMDFLRHIQTINEQQVLKQNSILCTMDVTSLYTNIPHDEGMRACKEALNSRSNTSPPTSFIIKLIQLVLTLNNFTFNDSNYLQKQGTAMGTCMAPSYANLFMGLFEHNLFNQSLFKPTFWRRYIDDIFFIWDHGIEELKKFILSANSFHPTIKFTCEHSLEKIDFLDITVHRINDRLETDLYCKPTDAHQYLHWTSCHPPHTRKNLPFGLAYRLRRICSTDNFLLKRLDELRTYLMSRKYTKSLIEAAIMKATSIPRSSTFQRKNKSQSQNRIPLVVTYQPGLPNLHNIVSKYFPILNRSKRCSQAIPNAPLIAFRRPRNLRDILVKAELTNPSNADAPNGFSPCLNKRCKTCPYVLATDSITSHTTKTTHPIKHKLNCSSDHVIYVISCKLCHKQYVGKTEQTLQSRLSSHRSSIRHKHDNPVARHFNSNNHNLDHLLITAIDHLPRAHTHKMLNKETYWIKTLKTISPDGINAHEQNGFPIGRY